MKAQHRRAFADDTGPGGIMELGKVFWHGKILYRSAACGLAARNLLADWIR